MTTIYQDYKERRLYRRGKWEYLLNDEAKTAWIYSAPSLGRLKRYRIPDSVIIDGEKYVIEKVDLGVFRKAKYLEHLVIPDSIGIIEESNFDFLPHLKSIYIGKGLQNLSYWPFIMNKKLSTIIIDKDNPHLECDKGIVYSRGGLRAIKLFMKKKNLVIKEGVEEIFHYFDSANTNIESIVFPSSLKKIGDNSFSECRKLKRVVLPEGFEDCFCQCFTEDDELEYVDLPSTMTHLHAETFALCPKLKTLIIRTNSVLAPQGFGKRPFPLEIPADCTVYVPLPLVDEYRKHPLWADICTIHGI